MGASHSWTIDDSQQHRVAIQHAIHSGRVKITVNNRNVFEQSDSHALWDVGFDHEFMIDELCCRIRISFPGGKPSYEFWVDGKLQPDGRYHAPV